MADHEPGDKLCSPHRAAMLEDEARLALLPEEVLVRLLDLRGSEDIADLGSGTGFYAQRLAAHTSGTVYAIELQPEMQRMHAAKPVRPNVRLILSHLDEVPLEPDSIDRAVSISTFHEAHGAAGLERVARALRPGGCLIVVDWRNAEDAADQGPRLEHRLSADEVGELLAPWFRVSSVEDLNTYMVAVVAEPVRHG